VVYTNSVNGSERSSNDHCSPASMTTSAHQTEITGTYRAGYWHFM